MAPKKMAGFCSLSPLAVKPKPKPAQGASPRDLPLGSQEDAASWTVCDGAQILLRDLIFKAQY